MRSVAFLTLGGWVVAILEEMRLDSVPYMGYNQERMSSF